MVMGYSFSMILFSTLLLYGLYILIGLFYYISTIGFLKEFKELRHYYANQWYVIPLMPLFNLLVFFIRFAGIINSINTDSAWKTKNFTQEKTSIKEQMADDFGGIAAMLRKVRNYVNNNEG